MAVEGFLLKGRLIQQWTVFCVDCHTCELGPDGKISISALEAR